jgi:hypothetical protein
MQDKQDRSGAPVRPLPKLKVVRETYCSQEMTDKCVDFLWERAPDKILRIIKEENYPRNADYFRAMTGAVEFLRQEASKEMDVPQTHLGLLDLSFELTRRIRKGHDFPEIKVEGKPLAPGPEGPFPPLVSLEIRSFLKEKGLTQSMVDEVIQALYERRPDLFFIGGECARRSASMGLAGVELEKNVWEIANEKKLPLTHLEVIDIKSEIGKRYRLMCGLEI